jgi:release factor glutamine methyltransferase
VNTIKEALQVGRQVLASTSETASLDAQVLLADLLNQPRAWVLGHTEAPLDTPQMDAYQARLEQYADGLPLPYVLGWWEFYGRRFEISPAVLIPRPETELLIDRALQHIAASSQDLRAADIGTGSGCIAVTLALEASDIDVVAVDRSSSALAIAHRNCLRFGVEGRVQLVQSDLLLPIKAPFDLICANLPYIPSATLAHLEVAQSEPNIALDGGSDGLEQIYRLLSQLGHWLAPGGMALLEIGAEHGDQSMAALLDLGLQAEVLQDLAGKDRMLVARNRA